MATGPVGHSEVGFSKSDQWLNCPGSVEAQRGLIDIPGAAAERGTMLHGIAAKWLETRDGAVFDDLDEEDVDLVMPYIQYVQDRQQRLGAKLLVEQPFHLEHLHPDLWGTADAVLLWQYGNDWWLEVADYKSGGTAVEIRGLDGRINTQVGGYLLGAIKVATAAGMRPTKFRISVVQPVRGGVKDTIVERKELPVLAADLLEGVERALTPGAPRVAGTWCQFCKASGTCPELREAALVEVINGFGPEPPEVFPVIPPTEEALLKALATIPLIKLWLKAIEGEAWNRLNSETGLTGWKLVAKRGRRKWIDEAQAEQRLQGAGLDRDVIGAWKLITPAQLVKLAKKLKIKVPIDALAPMKSSGATMAPIDDAREAIPPGAAMFDDEPESE
jgi:hypothetical protein